MSSIMQYIKAQLKQKVVFNPLMSLLSFSSPVVLFIISYVVGKCMNFEKENSSTEKSLQAVLILVVSYILYIGVCVNGAYDLIQEKKKFRKQHMYTHGFSLLKFYISWTIIYALLILPSCLIIVAIIHFTNIFPGINVIIIFLSFYLFQVAMVTFTFWISCFTSSPAFGELLSLAINIGLTITVFCVYYFANYKGTHHSTSGLTPIDRIIVKCKYAVNHGESVGLTDIFTREYIRIFVDLVSSIGSIIVIIILILLTDFFFISRHVKRSVRDVTKKSSFMDIIKNGPNIKVKSVPRNDENYQNKQGFFDWDEMRYMFKANKNATRDVYEEENNNIQQKTTISGREIINVENLFKKYSSSYELAISNVSFRAYTNEILMITGRPDAGKSTLMKMLYGRQSSSYGNIIINGKELGNNWKSISQHLSVAPKGDYVFMEDLSVSENIKLYSSMCSTKENGFSLLEELNFAGNTSDLIKNLSDVERTKVKIALALLKSKQCVFIEEPTALMSDKDVACFWNAIKARKNKRSIIVSTSSMYEALTYADRIVVLKDGMTQCIGSPEFVKNKLSVNENEPEIEVNVN